MARKRDPIKEAAAAAAAAVAASEAATLDEAIDGEAAELTEDVLEGLRRLDSGGNRVTWYVYCDAPLDREGFVEKLRTEQLDEERFQKKYGAGEYRVIGRTSDGHYVRGSHKIIKISGILAETTTGNSSGDVVTLLREMRADDERRAQQRAETAKGYATILAAPLATLGAAIISRRPSLDIPALIAALRPQQSTLTEMTTALTNLQSMGGGGNNVELVLKVLERLQDLPSGQGDTGWLGIVRDVIREAAPAAREVLGQLAQGRPLPPGPPFVMPPPQVTAQAPAVLPPPSHNNGATPQPSPAPEPQGGEMWTLVEPWFRRKAEDLLESASTNMPVELVAEHMLEAAERKFGTLMSAADLKALIERPDWWQFVVAFYPPIGPFQHWVADVRAEILGMLDSGKTEQQPGRAQGE